ncbi:hypothetical protein JL722_14297 [Aureococcus anophagefferens]|nr:hypothetical protein JL722_14297 [Aureococcus anophagefferens]
MELNRPNPPLAPPAQPMDQKVIELVKQHGARKWSQIAQQLPGRISKQCAARKYERFLEDSLEKLVVDDDKALAAAREAKAALDAAGVPLREPTVEGPIADDAFLVAPAKYKDMRGGDHSKKGDLKPAGAALIRPFSEDGGIVPRSASSAIWTAIKAVCQAPEAAYTKRAPRPRRRGPSRKSKTAARETSRRRRPSGPRPGDAAQALSPGFGDYGADSVMLSPAQLESAVGLDFLPGSGDASRRSSYGSELVARRLRRRRDPQRDGRATGSRSTSSDGPRPGSPLCTDAAFHSLLPSMTNDAAVPDAPPLEHDFPPPPPHDAHAARRYGRRSRRRRRRSSAPSAPTAGDTMPLPEAAFGSSARRADDFVAPPPPPSGGGRRGSLAASSSARRRQAPTEPSFKKTRTVLDDENAAENGAAPMSND